MNTTVYYFETMRTFEPSLLLLLSAAFLVQNLYTRFQPNQTQALGGNRKILALNFGISTVAFATILYATVFDPLVSRGAFANGYQCSLLAVMILLSLAHLFQQWYSFFAKPAATTNDTKETTTSNQSPDSWSWSLVEHSDDTVAPKDETSEAKTWKMPSISPWMASRCRTLALSLSHAGLVASTAMCLKMAWIVACALAKELMRTEARLPPFDRLLRAIDMLTDDPQAMATWEFWKGVVRSTPFHFLHATLPVLTVLAWLFFLFLVANAVAPECLQCGRRHLFQFPQFQGSQKTRLMLLMLACVATAVGWWWCNGLDAYVDAENPYITLGIPEDASGRQIKRAIRRIEYEWYAGRDVAVTAASDVALVYEEDMAR